MGWISCGLCVDSCPLLVRHKKQGEAHHGVRIEFPYPFATSEAGINSLSSTSPPTIPQAMENLQTIGGEEECSSSESGWTMYLASPMHGDGGAEDVGEVEGGDGEDDDDDDNGSSKDDVGKEGDEDDDAMASDASSGHAHCKHSHERCHGQKVMSHHKHDDDDDGLEKDSCSQHSSSKKIYKMKKRDESTGSSQREHRVAALPNSSKVRKAKWSDK